VHKADPKRSKGLLPDKAGTIIGGGGGGSETTVTRMGHSSHIAKSAVRRVKGVRTIKLLLWSMKDPRSEINIRGGKTKLEKERRVLRLARTQDRI